MKRPLFSILLFLALALAGCARYPMGLTKADWDALTPGQQARYRRMQESENRKVQYEFEQRTQATDQKVKNLEQRVQVRDNTP